MLSDAEDGSAKLPYGIVTLYFCNRSMLSFTILCEIINERLCVRLVDAVLDEELGWKSVRTVVLLFFCKFYVCCFNVFIHVVGL